jgi:hypothetical protein
MVQGAGFSQSLAVQTERSGQAVFHELSLV